jgi:hypothetical protein
LLALGHILLGIACEACASYSNVRFAPAIQDAELRGEADEVQARIVVAWSGIVERDDAFEVRFRVRIENPGHVVLTLVPAEFELLDGTLTAVGIARAENMPAVVAAGRSATFDIAFPVPSAIVLESLDLSLLTLRTRIQDRWSWNPVFERVERPYDDSGCGPAASFQFGFVFGN